jgi:hypothetical protein
VRTGVALRLTSALRERRADVGLIAAALVFGAFSLTYPFGHDQGLYYYVGREWLLHGRMPYRDCVEQKTPGIYLLNGVLVLLFGEQQLAIRLVDLVTIVLAGGLAAWVVTPHGQSPPPGRIGFTALATTVVYFGYFYFWDTAQCEVYFVVFALASHAAAARVRRLPWAAAAAGAFAGASFAMKPTSALFLPIVAAALGSRARREPEGSWARRASIAAALFCAGFAAVVGSLLLHFALHGALGDMFDVLVRANGYYVTHDRGVSSARDVLLRAREIFEWFNPFASLVLGAYVAAVIARALAGESALLRRLALPAAYFLAAFLSILVQLKFYRYHWGAFVGPVAIFAATAHAMCHDWLATRGHRAALRDRGLAAAVLVFYALAGDRTKIAWDGWRNTALWLSGGMTREQFTYQFAMPPYPLRYWYHDSEMAGVWLRAHSDPGDNVCARGFQPEVYEIAQRSYHGRFFWTYFLSEPKRFYRHEEWLAQDRADILRDPPRFLVTLADVHEGVESLEWFESLGLDYEPRAQWGFLTVSELARSSPRAARTLHQWQPP